MSDYSNLDHLASLRADISVLELATLRAERDEWKKRAEDAIEHAEQCQAECDNHCAELDDQLQAARRERDELRARVEEAEARRHDAEARVADRDRLRSSLDAWKAKAGELVRERDELRAGLQVTVTALGACIARLGEATPLGWSMGGSKAEQDAHDWDKRAYDTLQACIAALEEVGTPTPQVEEPK